jgi:carbon storage regulator
MPKGLVLTRKPGQTILVGDDIRIVVAEIRNGQVRFRIIAPPEIVIVRLETEEDTDGSED